MGNMATITFKVDSVDSGPQTDIGQYRTFRVMDGGEPALGPTGLSPDTYSDCANQGNSSSNNCSMSGCDVQRIIRGNIVVGSGS